jgi:hypothetical protein
VNTPERVISRCLATSAPDLIKEKLKALDEIPAVIVVHKFVTTLDFPNDDVLKQIRNVRRAVRGICELSSGYDAGTK